MKHKVNIELIDISEDKLEILQALIEDYDGIVSMNEILLGKTSAGMDCLSGIFYKNMTNKINK